MAFVTVEAVVRAAEDENKSITAGVGSWSGFT
jgi:hypothetical protein